MDNLYDNLENYDDGNIIAELKTENQDLRTKLEEYSSAMTGLQKDFDKLNSEFKKLEKNYSSLLKTARAEIERKSDIIKSLNLEKDLLVIKTLQSSGRSISATRSNINIVQLAKKTNEIDTECIVKQQKLKVVPLDYQNKVKNRKNDRIDSTSSQSEETTLSLENKSNFTANKESKKINNRFGHKVEKEKTKENFTKDNQRNVDLQCSKIKGQKIFNRRKSMSISRIEPIFSSDDDFEALNLKGIRKSPLKDDTRYYESQNMRDNNYSSSKDMYKYRTNRFMENDKYKHDKYESNQKYRRSSPKRYHMKYTKGDQELDKYMGDYSNQQMLRNHPIGKYHRSKSRDRWSSIETEKYYENDRHSPRHHNYSATKHKIRNELDEPQCKRPKTETNNKRITEAITSNYDREEIKYRDTEDNFMRHPDFIEPSSCQSPEYDNIDSTIPQHVIKEIKHTAATPLEDPRIISKKYVFKHNKEKPVLSTVISENINIKLINVSTWDIPNIKKFTLPVILNIEQLYEKTNRKLENKLPLDIKISLIKESLDSGEIESLKIHDNRCLKDSNDKLSGNVSNVKDQIENKTLNNTTDVELNKLEKSTTGKYKIPKIKKSDKHSTRIKHDVFEVSTKLSSKNYCNDNIKNRTVEKEKNNDTISNHEIHIEKLPNVENKMIYKQSIKLLPERTVITKSTLADDLSLSDEAYESSIVQKNTKKCKKILSKDKLHKNDIDLPPCEDASNRSELKEISKPVISRKLPEKEIKESCQRNAKTRKCKKNIELKETGCIKVTEKNKELQRVPKLKDKECKPATSVEIKNKFTALFGDSSSLITPDDLGLPLSEIQLPLDDKYVSIFDNTEDAVDLSVKVINSVKSNTPKTSTFQTNQEESFRDKYIKDSDNNAVNIKVSNDSANNETPSNTSENNLNESVLSETLNSALEIVKTVIISTGVQQTCTLENSILEESQNTEMKNLDKINDEANLKESVSNTNAQATSTPTRTINEDVDHHVPEPNVPNDATKIVEKNNLTSNYSNSSNHIPDKIENDADIPDVRIFVRRRRKFTKKP